MKMEKTPAHPEKAKTSSYNKRSKLSENGSNFDVNDNYSNRHTNRKVQKTQLIVDDLPPEMLEAILRNVATTDLLSCRQINRKWNEVSSRIMRQRADIQIAFFMECGQLIQSIQHRPQQTLLKDFWPQINVLSSLSLKDLIECLERSTHFPITNFRFKDRVTAGSDDIEHFLSIWGRNVHALGVKIVEVNDVEMLRVLLSEKTPNLKTLDIHFIMNEYSEQNMESAVRLFPDSNECELPKLNALRVKGSCDYFSGIVTDIIKAASNLSCFEKSSLNEDDTTQLFTAKDFTMLHSLDKIHCLKNVNLLFKDELITILEKLLQITDLRFNSIELSIDWIRHDHDLCPRAAKIISKIFDSSKNSLQKLHISPLGLLSGLVIPRFENLQKLFLTHDDDDDVSMMFPPLFDMADNFPNLQELTVCFFAEDDYFSTYQPINVMPNVELLRIVSDDRRYAENLMKVTPNVRTLLVAGDHSKAPTMNFKTVSTRLTKLENLGWQIYAASEHKLQSSCELESLITGFTKTFCKKMSGHFRDTEHLSAQKVASYEWHRKYFSILDLKELKRFDMSFTLSSDSYGRLETMCDCEESDCECSTDDDGSCDMAGFHRDSNLYKSCLTKVSQFLAFDLMPNLETHLIRRFLP